MGNVTNQDRSVLGTAKNYHCQFKHKNIYGVEQASHHMHMTYRIYKINLAESTDYKTPNI